MIKPIQVSAAELPATHKAGHVGYEYSRRELLPNGAAKHCKAALYEVPPHKAAFPYHYHLANEESFYILQGHGVLKTPSGERPVQAGDFLFFPAQPAGAHKLTNTSDTELLVYLDYDTCHDVDVAFYPDSEKIGVWPGGQGHVYRLADEVDYYEGE